MSALYTQSLCARRVKRALRKLGCVEYRQGRHTVYVTRAGRRFSVPLAHNQTSIRALKHALERVGLSWDEFEKQY